ncbi:hypothetical protein Pcinc_031408 [Petrolisthes cinctipes]|uniref:PiggyBac transposable element-derived protein domain-containing protein n=1 Tax=Petrolisthes cinctipes TaxID=88211 RepID=A0AAE1K142_PETCI|nr:hypothetical protein Pcinc_031408 [Petrolisthes cinctipes]
MSDHNVDMCKASHLCVASCVRAGVTTARRFFRTRRTCTAARPCVRVCACAAFSVFPVHCLSSVPTRIGVLGSIESMIGWVGTVGLTTAQILSILEEDPPNEPTDIVLVPPDENNTVSDEDSDVEEGGPKDPNHIGSRLMNQQAEMEKHTSQDNDEEIDSWLEEEQDEMGRRRMSQDNAILDDTLAEPGPSSSNLTRKTPKRMKLVRVKNADRLQRNDNIGSVGKYIPAFPTADLFTVDNLPIDINKVKNPYDYMKLFIPDKLVDKIVKETKRYSAQQNCPTFQVRVDRDLIRASHAIMLMSGYITPAQRRMYWEKKEDTANLLVRKTMSRNTFDDDMRYTHFINSEKPKVDDRFWKVRPLFNAINKAAEEYIEKTEYVSVDESMIKYFGPHPLKQFIKGKPVRFGYKVWVLATSTGELIHCEPYGGSQTKLFNYGLGQGPKVVYGLVEDAKLVAGTKVACDNLFTRLDLLDNMSKKGIGVVGMVRQNRLSKLSLLSKKQAQKMKRGQMEKVYVSGDQVIAVWKDSAPVYVASNFADVSPMGKCNRYSSDEKKEVEVDAPNIIKVYNTNMGGVDLVDNMM